MSRRLFAVVMVWASLGGAALAASSAEARRNCGTVTDTDGSRAVVTVERGQPSCRTARRVARTYIRGGGVVHTGSDSAHSGSTIGAWGCGAGTGGGACTNHATGAYILIQFTG